MGEVIKQIQAIFFPTDIESNSFYLFTIKFKDNNTLSDITYIPIKTEEDVTNGGVGQKQFSISTDDIDYKAALTGDMDYKDAFSITLIYKVNSGKLEIPFQIKNSIGGGVLRIIYVIKKDEETLTEDDYYETWKNNAEDKLSERLYNFLNTNSTNKPSRGSYVSRFLSAFPSWRGGGKTRHRKGRRNNKRTKKSRRKNRRTRK